MSSNNENENDKTLMSSNDDIENENDNTLMPPKDENENDKTLISSNDDIANKKENENEDDDDDYETMSQNGKIKDLNDLLDGLIDKSKSFEEQIKLLKKLKGLKGYQRYKDFGDKESNFKYFKIELADMSNDVDEKSFKQILGHTLEKRQIN